MLGIQYFWANQAPCYIAVWVCPNTCDADNGEILGHRPEETEFFVVTVKCGLHVQQKKLCAIPLKQTLAQLALDMGLEEQIVDVIGRVSDSGPESRSTTLT